MLPLVLPTPRDMELLSSYSWPGNIRELASVIDRAAILGNGKLLEVEKAIGLGHGHAPPPDANGQRGRCGEMPEDMALDSVVKRHIEAVLSLTKGRIEGRQGRRAARNQSYTLRGRMRKLSIDWSRFRGEP